MLSRKLLSSADLARTQALYIYETTKVVKIGKNKELMFIIL